MREPLKHQERRRALGLNRYLQGVGIDIGCGDSPVENAQGWDLAIDSAMDAHDLPMADETFDFVHSSHCLEHLGDPVRAVREWWRVLREGGHLIVVVPDFGLYEQRQWPSPYNRDHKTQWSLVKLVNLLSRLKGAEVIQASRNDAGYDYTVKRYDRTLGPALADVEVVVRKYSTGHQSLFGSECS